MEARGPRTTTTVCPQLHYQLMALPSFELGTFCVLGRRDNHYTTEPCARIAKFITSPQHPGMHHNPPHFTLQSTNHSFISPCNRTSSLSHHRPTGWDVDGVGDSKSREKMHGGGGWVVCVIATRPACPVSSVGRARDS